jgi:hypothetical protein
MGVLLYRGEREHRGHCRSLGRPAFTANAAAEAGAEGAVRERQGRLGRSSGTNETGRHNLRPPGPAGELVDPAGLFFFCPPATVRPAARRRRVALAHEAARVRSAPARAEVIGAPGVQPGPLGDGSTVGAVLIFASGHRRGQPAGESSHGSYRPYTVMSSNAQL